ncbi:MAG TPA: uroporphyrinogen decarboxylase family protein [Chloroflexota bacterium]
MPSTVSPQANARERALALLQGQRVAPPVFTGLSVATLAAMRRLGLQPARIHQEAAAMAAVAAEAVERYGFDGVAVPFDLMVEAEALGATVDYSNEFDGYVYPAPDTRLVEEVGDVRWPSAVADRGRVPVVCEAIQRLRQRLGPDRPLGAWVCGPYTLATQLVEPAELLVRSTAEPEAVRGLLEGLVPAIADVASAYRSAGADFITVHEMGGSPSLVGPRLFDEVVRAPLAALVRQLPAPVVVSVCGQALPVIDALATSGAAAIHVDHQTDLAAARARLGPNAVLLGNVDPLGVIGQGTPEAIVAAVRAARRAGASAVWPGCDLFSGSPEENLRAFVAACRAEE